MLNIVIILALALCCLLGVALTALRLPGTWLIIVIALVYGWWTQWERVGWVMMAVLIGIALVGEAVELLASVFTARKVGASRRAAWGGVIGGVLGMVFLSIPVFFPPLGTIVGALVGCFAGAAMAELTVRGKTSASLQGVTHGTKVGIFSALGFVLGTVTKIALALLMSAIVLTSVACPTADSTPPPGDVSNDLQQERADTPYPTRSNARQLGA
jgi:uncharacterized protein YqgC (DUF456 family)